LNTIIKNNLLECAKSIEANYHLFWKQLDLIYPILTESIYAIDVLKNRFCYISPDFVFQSEYTAEDVLNSGGCS